jgi:RNA polymerase-binding transcription factor DksA
LRRFAAAKRQGGDCIPAASAVTLRQPLEGDEAMADVAAAKARLEAQLAELEERLARIAEDLSEPLNRDSDEQAIELEDDDSLEGQKILITREIASVKRALGRIEDGTYGDCVRCGEPIAPARLEARPEASLCIDCARAAM